ncbi:MAG TPA: hypothetical protein VJX29_11875 [Candidatus Acidoferrales bacterium]|nr:hypothetical protein [Candidatus Acidoferrales bacterium]
MPTLTMPDALRFLRYGYSAVLVMVVLLTLAAETLLPTRPAEPPVIVNLLYALAAGDALIALVYRRKFSGPAAEALHTNPQDGVALANWVKGQLVPLPMALGMGVMGLASHVLGAPTRRAGPIYFATVLLLLVAWPSEPAG